MDPLKVALNSRTSGKFSEVEINGRPHLVTLMVPIVGNTAMNRILYPEAEVSASYQQLNMLPAPAGHPWVNGVAVSASHPLAVNAHNIGGLIRSPRRNGKQVTCEFCIDIEVANAKPEGVETMRRIKASEQVGVSTGLTINSVLSESGEDDFGGAYDHVGAGFKFDHVAILLNEEAAGSHVGTALITNALGEMETVFVADIKPQATESAPGAGMGISTRQLHELLEQMISAEVSAQQAGDDFYAWVRDSFPESMQFLYSVEVEGVRRLFTRGYSVDAAGKVSLGSGKVPVVEQTRLVPEGSLTNEEVTDMDKTNFVLALIANSNGRLTIADKDRLVAMSETELATAATPVFNNDQARELLTADGFDFEAFAQYQANSAAFDEFLAKEGARVDEIRGVIVANSEYTAEDLKDYDEAALVKLNTAIVPKKALHIGAGSTVHNSNAGGSEESVAVDFS